jgi:N-6 DNA Methylase
VPWTALQLGDRLAATAAAIAKAIRITSQPAGPHGQGMSYFGSILGLIDLITAGCITMTFPSVDARAVRICERAAEAWWGCRGHGESAVPISVIAALCLADGINPKALLAAADEDIVRGIAKAWAAFWLRRPDLCIRCGPLAAWLNDDPLDRDLVRAAAAVARAAVRAGICDVLGEHTRSVDILGHAYITMRPKSAAQARGEFYTPAALCDVVARMTFVGDLTPGMSIAEPAAGTGGMLRAAAQVMRESGHDPADYWWVVNDISPLVTAALAVNCHLWGLGHHVVIRAADTLAEPDWPASSWAEQREAIAQRDAMTGTAAVIAAVRNAEHLIRGISDPAAPHAPAAPDIELPGMPLSTGPAVDAAPSRRRGPAGGRPPRSPRARKQHRADGAKETL